VKVRTIQQLRRRPTEHTGWCGQGHRCGINEHRSPAQIVDELGARATLTRVRAGGVDYAEVTARIPLAALDVIARRQIGLALHLLRRLFGVVAAVRPEQLPAAAGRPAIERREEVTRR
jgi:hypothetical protein